MEEEEEEEEEEGSSSRLESCLRRREISGKGEEHRAQNISLRPTPYCEIKGN